MYALVTTVEACPYDRDAMSKMREVASAQEALEYYTQRYGEPICRMVKDDEDTPCGWVFNLVDHEEDTLTTVFVLLYPEG